MVKAFRQKSFSFKRLHYSIKNYTKTVIPYSLSQELMTAAFTAALNGIYLFIIPMAFGSAAPPQIISLLWLPSFSI